jgi:hypothetical protein
MENTAHKSCWGITTKAVLIFSAVLFMGYLLGGF